MHVDGVADLDGAPRVVSVSDVHGHRERFESALLTLADHPECEPIVERGSDGLRWVAGTSSALVINGDVVNKGPDSAGCLDLVWRLQRDAPDGHVRFLLGNSELGLVYPTPPEYDVVYAHRVGDDERRAFLERMASGDVALAFEGHRYDYVHAGAPEGVDPASLDESLRSVATAHLNTVGKPDERESFDRLVAEHCPDLESPDIDPDAGEDLSDAPEAGCIFLHFSHLPADAPRQIVGHTPRKTITRTGNVVCQDVVLENAESPGGEAVLVETGASLRAAVRESDGSVSVRPV